MHTRITQAGRQHASREVARFRTLALPVAASPHLLYCLLLVPLIFLAVRGNLSIQAGTDSNLANEGSLSALVPTRHLGLFGSLIFPGLAYGIICLQIMLHSKAIERVALSMKTLTAMALVTICSALWSQAPFRSTYNGAFYLIGTLFAYYLVVRFRPEQIMDLLMVAGTVICLADIFLVVFFPQYGLSSTEGRTAGAWRGLFVYRTGASNCLTFLLTPAIVFGYRRFTPWRVAYILLVVGSLVMARSVTGLAMASAYVSIMVVLHLAHYLERRTMLGVYLLVLSLVLAALCLILPHSKEILALMGRDPTLTGRTEIWKSLLPSIAKHPFLGYGFYAFWQGLKGESALVILAAHWIFGYAHNGYLDVVLQLGCFGLLLLAISLFRAVRNALTCFQGPRSAGVDWLIGLLALTIFFNFDEETILWPNDLLSVLYVVCCCGLAAAAAKLRADRHAVSSIESIQA